MNMKIGYNDFVAETRRKIAELAKAGPKYKIGSKVINKRNGQQARIVSVSGNMVNVKSSSKDGKLKADCSANFPKAKSIVWNFGDGKTSNLFQTQHAYSKPGTYTITITIQDSCGERVLKKKVVF